jgi:hypothetical protein
MKRFCLLSMGVFAFSLLFGSGVLADSTYTVQLFATGTATSSSSPDSVDYGDGSIWIAYQNGADSTGASGSSTVVRYAPDGSIINTWTIAGNVDGLKVDPGTGLVWALQNNDGNSKLTVINPITNATTQYTYGNSYTNVANRGFDDVVFTKGATYLSETNPASETDPVVVKLTTGLSSPLQVSGILKSTFTGFNKATRMIGTTSITDSDSLKLITNGTLVLTGEADQELAFIHNPGQSNQSESFLALLGTDGKTIGGFPDDTIFPNATNGYFIIADTGANKVYQIWATGLAPGSVYIDVGDEFGILNTNTGVVTPIFTGVSPHGADFVPTPEPGTLSLTIAGVVLLGGLLVAKQRFV